MWAGVLLCIAFVMWNAAVRADTFYKYRDKRTGRDVYVNRFDQIPRRYRSQAKVAMDTSNRADDSSEAPPAGEEEAATPVPGATPPATEHLRTSAMDLRKAILGRNPWKVAPVIIGAMVDAKLVKAGTTPLGESERAQLGHMVGTILVFSLLAGLFAIVVWVVMIVSAVRQQHPWWAVLIFLLSPLAYVYLFVHAEKWRWPYKLSCTLGMLSPALVALVGVWRFQAWLHAVIQARGGHV